MQQSATTPISVLLFVLAALLPRACTADLPKATFVSPRAVAPGQTTVVAVKGLNLTDATELWTNLDADIQNVAETTSETQHITSALADGVEAVPAGTIIVEAEDFDRGQYRKAGAVILNGDFKPNFAEWDFEIPAVGHYVLELKYAAGASRPTKLFVNGRLLTESAAAGVTRGFADSDAEWNTECVLALKQGKNTLRLELAGGTPHFDKLALVPTKLPASRFASVAATDRVAPFEVTVPADAPVGIFGLRVATTEGISNPLLFMVDDLPTIDEVRSGNSGENAQTVQLPAAIEGYCDVGSADRYLIHAEAGEQISIEVAAARLGSKLDPLLRLVSAAGEELAFIDDSVGMAGDCCLRYRFENAGDYIVELEDALSSGASGHWYRLRMGDFPLISTTLPAVVQRDGSTSVTFGGLAVKDLSTTHVPAVGATPSRFVSVAFPDKIGSGYTEVSSSAFPQVVIQSGQVANIPAIPCGLSGVLASLGDEHTCRFQARKGELLQFRDVGRMNGGATILAMAIRNADNKTLVETRKADAKSRELKWKVPDDGEYLLVLTDLTSRGGANFNYYVEIQQAEDDFQLSVERNSVILPQNGYAILKVTADRRGYNGPISLAVSGLGTEVQLRNEVIAEKAKETRLKIYSPTNYQPGQTQAIEVTGTATVGEQVLHRRATTIAAMRKLQPQSPFPPASLDGLIATVGSPEIPDFFSLSLDDNAVLFPRFVGEVYFTVRVSDRAAGFKDPVNIRVEGLPEGFRAGGGERAVSRSDNNEYRFLLNGPSEIELSEIPIQIIAEATFKGQTKEVAVAGSRLKIVDPLIVRVFPAAPLSPGNSDTLKIAARRFVPRAGGDRKQIAIRFSSVPSGVMLPDSATIPAGKNEATVRFGIGPEVDIESLRQIVVTASTVVAEREVVVKSSVVPEATQ